MNLSNLKPAAGSTHHEKRIGRGQGSGHGGTSTPRKTVDTKNTICLQKVFDLLGAYFFD